MILLIVGLGNPGSAYETTRHNVGFMVIDELLRRYSCTLIKKASFEGDLYRFDSHFLLKPLTFMNLSGRSIAAVKNFYKIENVIVIHDDLDLPFGALRFKNGGGHGGHNGLKSADASIGQEYVRVRMGVGRPEEKSKVVDYVLSSFSKDEQEYLPGWIALAADAIELLFKERWEKVASKCSIKKIPLE